MVILYIDAGMRCLYWTVLICSDLLVQAVIVLF